jgi:hypothetical protein
MKTETDTDQGLVTLEITKLTIGGVENSEFELPTGYKQVPISESAVNMGQ